MTHIAHMTCRCFQDSQVLECCHRVPSRNWTNYKFKRHLSILRWAWVHVGTGPHQQLDNGKVPFLSCHERTLLYCLWSLLAPDFTSNRTTSRCPFRAAARRGVVPSSLVPWSLLAPDSTSNPTTSRCPF